MRHTYITFEVAENPSRDVIIKHRKNGDVEMIYQMTQEKMDEVMTQNLKKRAK